MNSFVLYIDGQDVNKYIDASTFDSFVTRVEGDSLWEFRNDSLTFEMDRLYLDELSVKIYALEVLQKKEVILKYYRRTVFLGSIKESDFDYETETLTVGVYGISKIISEISVTNFGYSTNTSLWYLCRELIKRINQYLQDNSYPFIAEQYALLDVQDFPFYKSLSSLWQGNVSFPSGDKFYKDTVTINDMMGFYYRGYEGNVSPLFAIFGISSKDGQSQRFYAVPVNDSGLDIVNRDNNHSWIISGITNGYLRKADDVNDDGIHNFIKATLVDEGDEYVYYVLRSMFHIKC